SWMENKVFHHKFIIWFQQRINRTVEGETDNYSIEECKILLNEFPKEHIDELIKKSPYYKATANDVDWEEKIRMQGSIQKWIDHSISVTVNIPNEAAEELVDKIYMT